VDNKAKVIMINGPVVKGCHMSEFKMREMVMVGEKKLIGEVISLEGDVGTIQVYEETEGLFLDEVIEPTHKPLSLKLGPGLLKNMFDGIERPLKKLFEISGDFIAEGIGLISIDDTVEWDVNLMVEEDDYLDEGYPVAWIQETEMIKHKILMPPGKRGRVKKVAHDGLYKIEDVICVVEDEYGDDIEIKFEFKSNKDFKGVYFDLAIFNSSDVNVLYFKDTQRKESFDIKLGENSISFMVKKLNINNGYYYMGINLMQLNGYKLFSALHLDFPVVSNANDYTKRTAILNAECSYEVIN